MKRNHLLLLALALVLGATVLSFVSCGQGGPSGGGSAPTFSASLTGGTS